MRVEPHHIGSVLHVMKRGARGMEIVRDDRDRYNFVRSLFLLNDEYQNNDWRTLCVDKPLFYRPGSWPKRSPLVSILAWTLLDNHFHMLLQEVKEGGVAKFMQRLCGSMTLAFNERHEGRGSIFQGSYKGRLVDTDEYLHYVHAYITVKNTFEVYDGGIKNAVAQFDKAWAFAQKYPFTSFLTATTGIDSPLLDMKAIDSLGLIRKDFKKYARSMLATHAKTKEINNEMMAILLENW